MPVQLSTVVVLGSADHKFSVWPLHAKIPMVCAKGIFSQGVMDVAWLPSGLALFACSYDGTVAMAKFDEGELGECCCVGLGYFLDQGEALNHDGAAATVKFEAGRVSAGVGG